MYNDRYLTIAYIVHPKMKSLFQLVNFKKIYINDDFRKYGEREKGKFIHEENSNRNSTSKRNFTKINMRRHTENIL